MVDEAKLTNPLFALGDDVTGDAYLPWGFAAWGAYVSGYRDAGRALANAIGSSELLPEWTFYPIAFLYRHCLELEIKSITLNARQLVASRLPAPIGHDLLKLWATAREALAQASVDLGEERLDQVDRTISHLAQADPTGESFRYPLDTKGLPTLPTVRSVNIRTFARQLDDLVDVLFRLNADVHTAIKVAEELQEIEDDEMLWISGY